MWETCGVAGEVDVRPTSEGYADLALALDLRASLVTAEATLQGALARTESRGAHQRRDHPELSPELWVNFQTRMDAAGGLTIATQAVLPIPPELRALADATPDVGVAGRLLE